MMIFNDKFKKVNNPTLLGCWGVGVDDQIPYTSLCRIGPVVCTKYFDVGEFFWLFVHHMSNAGSSHFHFVSVRITWIIFK